MIEGNRRRHLCPQAEELLDVILGRPTERVPYFELFFDNPPIMQHFLGREGSREFPDRLAFAIAIGWGSVCAASFGLMHGRRSAVASDGTSHYAGGSPLTWQALEDLTDPELDPLIEQYLVNARAARAEGMLAHVFLLHCFHSAATGIGLERLSLMVYDEPELLAAYMRRVEQFNQRVLRALLSTGVLPDLVFFDGDCAFKNALMVSPQVYRELIFEPTAATCRICRDAGIPFLLHTDGRIDEVYPVWLDLGFVGAHSVEKQANDLGEIKRRFGDRMTLFGNFDPVELALGRPEEIRRAAAEMVRVGKPGGRYVAAVNTIVGREVPLKNYLAFLDGVAEASAY